jgi:carboxymethylenebutenolidase
MKCLLLCLAALTANPLTASAQDWAKARLDQSPRHLEWVTLKNGTREVKCFLGFPEVKNKAPVIVLIHEIFGLTDWVRSMVDQFAEAGYVAIAPDFLSGTGPNGGGTDSLGGPDGARGKIQGLAQTQIDADLDAAIAYAKKLDACNGKVVVGGFCWGGGKTFLYATHNPDLKAGLVFYGSAAKAEDMPKIKAPIYGFYGGNDARINAGIPATIESMQAADRFFEPKTYEGAGHGFMRAGEDPAGSAENQRARAEAWQRLRAILAKL